jgi:integrase/recombinase XerD
VKKHSTEAIPLILDFCIWLTEQKKSPNTIETYKRELEKYHEWLQGRNTDLSHFEKDDIQSYANYLEVKQKSVATIDKTIGVIRTFAKFLGRPELTFGIEIKPVEKNNEIDTLSAEEYDRLLEKVMIDGDLRNIAIVYVLLHTGIRVSELCKLNRSHVDFINHELVVEKIGDNDRVIPLSFDTRMHLKTYLDTHSAEAIFVSQAGERLSERAIQYILKKYEVNPQKLRHTFCQRLVNNKVDIETVSRLAGHKDINVTKRYVKSQMSKRKVEEAINDAFTKDKIG